MNVVVPFSISLTSHDTNTVISGVTWSKESCCTLFQSSWPNKCNGAIGNAISVTRCQHTCYHAAPHFDCLDLGNAMVSLSSPYTNPCDIGVTWPKSYVASDFDCLDLTNMMVPLIILSASCNTGTNSNSVTWTKNVMFTLFPLSWFNKCNSAFDDAVGVSWYWHQCKWCLMIKIFYCILFQSFQSNKGNGALTVLSASHNASSSGVKLQKIMLHLVSVILT